MGMVRLGDISDITKLAGFEFTKYVKYNETGEIIALRALNLRNGRLDLSDIKRIDRSVSDSLIRSKLFVNDILLTYTGNGYGDCALIEENDKYHLAPNICKISPDVEKVDPYFLYLVIRDPSFRVLMSNYVTGSGQPTIPMKTIRVLEINCPEIERQLSSHGLNDYITIHDFKRLIIKERNKVSDVNNLGTIGDVKGGKRLPKGVNLIAEPNSHPYIRVRDLNNVVFASLSADYEYVDDETQKSISRYITAAGDVLISIVGTIGLTAIVDKSLNNANLTENCVKVTNLVGITPEYLLLYLRSAAGVEAITKGTVGAVQLKLPIKNIQAIPIPLLPKSEIEPLNDVLIAIFTQMAANVAESKSLAKTRDTLLPKLMSGELDVSDTDL